ncbi:hypothetical protein PORY_001190 [Pneumocystis oryctolagi]|uniref:Uncharacterized protein n=1 Tax=Pneumocystis oryctolagi TaxID=42067 RepID=A0ACB7CD08_9ASCO|nr:hypothetical protein PORY_001190 [Pneumocystis oryctolagi]
MKIFFSSKCNTPRVRLGRIWGQYFQAISKKIILKKPQFHCDLFNLRFYPREDLNTCSFDGKDMEKSAYRVSQKSNIYYFRGLVRITVLTSKKRVSNMACIRSRIRRRLREAARQVLLFQDENGFPYLPVVPYDLFFVAKVDVLHENWKKLLWHVEKGLQRAQKILNSEHISNKFVSMKIQNLESLLIDNSSRDKLSLKSSIYTSLKNKSITSFEKKTPLQSKDFITLQFINSVIKITNSPCSTSVDKLSKNIKFLLEYYKLREITSFDIEMLTRSFRQYSQNIDENYFKTDKTWEIDD